MGNTASSPASKTNVCMGISGAAFAALNLFARSSSPETAALDLYPRAAPDACKVVEVSPKNRRHIHCGDGGTLQRPATIKTYKNADSVEACADVCLNGQGDCVSFSYNAKATSCTTYRKSLNDQGFRESQTGVKYYNRHCFRCAKCTTVFLTADDQTYDDNYWKLTLPFPLKLYKVQTSVINVTSNGQIILKGDGHDTDRTSSTGVPDYDGGDADTAFFPLWQDLRVNNNAGQSMYYSIEGKKPNRAITFAWTTASGVSASLETAYDFRVLYEEANPGIWTLVFYKNVDGGATGTIGMQSQSSGDKYYSWSYNTAAVPENREFKIVFNSQKNSAKPRGPDGTRS